MLETVLLPIIATLISIPTAIFMIEDTLTMYDNIVRRSLVHPPYAVFVHTIFGILFSALPASPARNVWLGTFLLAIGATLFTAAYVGGSVLLYRHKDRAMEAKGYILLILGITGAITLFITAAKAYGGQLPPASS